MTKGDRVVAYDPRVWMKRMRDLGHNEDCWKPATVLLVYRKRGELLADLLFDHDPDVSHGHFAEGPCSGIQGATGGFHKACGDKKCGSSHPVRG